MCGGNATGGSTGQCGDGFNCVSGTLAKNDVAGLTDCSKAGQTSTGGGASDQLIFGYPLAGDLCNTAGETLADCCRDKNLVTITSDQLLLSDGAHGGPSLTGIITAQGSSGKVEAYEQ
jgi:hypothetical protein